LDVSIVRADDGEVSLPFELALIAAGGVLAGAANVLAGAGSLLTYPLLIAVGLPPIAANVTNDIGVVPGNMSGVVGVREGLRGQGPLLRTAVPVALAGSLLGAVLLLEVPGSAFAWVAPPLLFLASVLTLAQPALARRAAERPGRPRVLRTVIGATATYGGYFGTGIGLIFMGALSVFVDDSPAHLNSVKNVLQCVTNGLAGVVFAFVAPVHWELAAALAAGTLAGAQLGARWTRQISPQTLRIVIATIGMAAALWLFVHQLT
jgi:uncharacterized protein